MIGLALEIICDVRIDIRAIILHSVVNHLRSDCCEFERTNVIAAVFGTVQAVITPPVCRFVGCERAVTANAMVRKTEDNILMMMMNGGNVEDEKPKRIATSFMCRYARRQGAQTCKAALITIGRNQRRTASAFGILLTPTLHGLFHISESAIS